MKIVAAFLVCMVAYSQAALLDGGKGTLEKILPGIGNVVKYTVEDLGHLAVPATVDDVAELVKKVSQVVEAVGNLASKGMGTQLRKLIDEVAQGVLCGVGSPGLTGSILGHLPAGGATGNDIKYCKGFDQTKFCTKYCPDCGWGDGDGDGNGDGSGDGDGNGDGSGDGDGNGDGNGHGHGNGNGHGHGNGNGHGHGNGNGNGNGHGHGNGNGDDC